VYGTSHILSLNAVYINYLNGALNESVISNLFKSDLPDYIIYRYIYSSTALVSLLIT